MLMTCVLCDGWVGALVAGVGMGGWVGGAGGVCDASQNLNFYTKDVKDSERRCERPYFLHERRESLRF